MPIRTLLTFAFVLLAACGASRDGEADSLTARERDSAIGASKVPGAAGVNRALRAADSADARNARLDSIGSEP